MTYLPEIRRPNLPQATSLFPIASKARDYQMDDEYLPDLEPECSYRGQPYRYVNHQNGVMGVLRIVPITGQSLRHSGGESEGGYVAATVGLVTAQLSSAQARRAARTRAGAPRQPDAPR